MIKHFVCLLFAILLYSGFTPQKAKAGNSTIEISFVSDYQIADLPVMIDSGAALTAITYQSILFNEQGRAVYKHPILTESRKTPPNYVNNPSITNSKYKQLRTTDAHPSEIVGYRDGNFY